MLLKNFFNILEKKKIICFDLDGVLIDSIKNMEVSWNISTTQNKISISFEKYKKHIGLPFQKILKRLDISNNTKKIEKIYQSSSLKYLSKIKPKKELIKLLNYLYESKFFIVIITSKDFKRTRELLNKFKINHHLVITPEKLKRGKPHNDAVKLILEKFKVNKKYLIYFGDTKIDYNFSKNSGITHIHCEWGYENFAYKNTITLKQIKYFNENFNFNSNKKRFEKNKK